MEKQERRILIVEDEDIVRKILEMQISSFGYKPHTAELPGEGLAWFRDHHSEIDLVLLDMNMPEMDGLEVFRKMKEIDPAVNVLVLSGYSQHGKIEAALREGVIDYMTKPVRKAVLGGKIKEILGESEPAEAGRDDEALSPLDGKMVINSEFLEGQFAGTPGLMVKVIESFLSSAPTLCDALEEAVQSGNAEEIAARAHKCHGPIVSLGGDRAGAYAKAIEMEAEAGNPPKVNFLMPGFRRAFDALIQALKNVENR